ncbi:MAG: ATP-binding protein [Deltaproteobacteria bacterium]|nr:ATP-binding protein [Deltaproteobacteria bacterium]
MSKPFVIIITGLSGTGKTTLGKHLAQRYNLPCIHKDGIKEVLFDTIENCSAELSRKLGLSSVLLLHYVTIALVTAGQSLIVEANFNPKLATSEWLTLKEKYNFETLQIQCHTEGTVLLDRFKKRIGTKERHPGHYDRVELEYIKSGLLQGRQENLEIGGYVYELDTTDFERVNYQSLYAAIETKLKLHPRGENIE